MNKQEVAKKYLNTREHEIWSRTELKKANEYKVIGDKFSVSPQRIQVEYKKACDKIDILYDNLYKDEI